MTPDDLGGTVTNVHTQLAWLAKRAVNMFLTDSWTYTWRSSISPTIKYLFRTKRKAIRKHARHTTRWHRHTWQERLVCSSGLQTRGPVVCVDIHQSRVPPSSSGVMFILLTVGPHWAIWSKHFSGSLFTYERVNIKEKSKQANTYHHIRPDWKGRTSASEPITCASLFAAPLFRCLGLFTTKLSSNISNFLMFELYHISRY